MASRCPICKQVLPEALDTDALNARLEKFTATALARDRRQMRKEAEKKLEEQMRRRENEIIARTKREATAERKDEIKVARHEAVSARRRLAEVERKWKKELARHVERAESQAARLAAKEHSAEVKAVELARQKDRARHESELTRMQRTVDSLSRKLEKQANEHRGDSAEVNLLALLRTTFSGDRIERIGKGVKGADLVQHVMVDGREAGRIVYESKNVTTWQNAFVAKAKGYQTRYDTPYVIIVTRSLPPKERALCVRSDVPIVEPGMVVPLAAIIRSAIAEIGQVRQSSTGREQKAKLLFDYILSDGFRTRFAEIADSLTALRDQQHKERDWHENAWQQRSKLCDQIDGRRREIQTRIRAISRGHAGQLRVASGLQ